MESSKVERRAWESLATSLYSLSCLYYSNFLSYDHFQAKAHQHNFLVDQYTEHRDLHVKIMFKGFSIITVNMAELCLNTHMAGAVV